jgi:hypothetical protein
MPTQQRARRDQPGRPLRPGQQPGQGGEYHPVDPVQLRPGMLLPQDRDLLTQHQQLGVLRRRRARQQHQPASQADEHQVEHPNRHKPAMLRAVWPTPRENWQVSRLCAVLEPYRPRAGFWHAQGLT